MADENGHDAWESYRLDVSMIMMMVMGGHVESKRSGIYEHVSSTCWI